MLQLNEAIEPLKTNLQAAAAKMGDLRKSLSGLSKEDLSLLPETRLLKVHEHLRTNGRKPTVHMPEIVLRGSWLEKFGFSYNNQYVYVITTDEMIIITPEPKKISLQRMRALSLK